MTRPWRHCRGKVLPTRVRWNVERAWKSQSWCPFHGSSCPKRRGRCEAAGATGTKSNWVARKCFVYLWENMIFTTTQAGRSSHIKLECLPWRHINKIIIHNGAVWNVTKNILVEPMRSRFSRKMVRAYVSSHDWQAAWKEYQANNPNFK